MTISIYRNSINCMYTLGTLLINGRILTSTVEATQLMLPPGFYSIRIVKHSARKQVIGIFGQDGTNTQWTVALGHSWIDSHKSRLIAIGTQLIPGVVYKATPIFERITDRLMKAHGRKEEINLIISEFEAVHNHPSIWWQKPALHNV